MNTPQPYIRRSDRALPGSEVHEVRTLTSATGHSPAGAEVNRLAVHGDPSLAQSSGSAPRGGPGLVWMRPTELAAAVGTTLTSKAIDLEVALAQKVRRAPVTATRAVHRTAQRRLDARQAHVPQSTPSTAVTATSRPAIEGPGLS